MPNCRNLPFSTFDKISSATCVCAFSSGRLCVCPKNRAQPNIVWLNFINFRIHTRFFFLYGFDIWHFIRTSTKKKPKQIVYLQNALFFFLFLSCFWRFYGRITYFCLFFLPFSSIELDSLWNRKSEKRNIQSSTIDQKRIYNERIEFTPKETKFNEEK